MHFIGRPLVSAAALLVLTFLLAPIIVIAIYAFSDGSVQHWPIRHFSTRAIGEAWNNREIRAAFNLSLCIAITATFIAFVLATMLALVVHRFRFPGRNVAAFVVVLPIALPGIITGIALNSYFATIGMTLSTLTVVIAHATFCIVIIYNTVLARLRRVPRSLVEASADLGAGSWRTFLRVTLPMMSSALASGGLLAFALSFDEVIVSTFTAGVQTTLPLWIFGSVRLGQDLNQVNVVVLAVIVLTALPVLLSHRLARNAEDVHR
jgi:putative spermidine/putrescine transport system permease protein